MNMEQSQPSRNTGALAKSRTIFSIKNIVIVVLAVLCIFFAIQYFSNDESAEEKALQKQKATIEKVGKLIDLPKGEEPTIAIVKDKKALNDQPFFDKAKDGDTVLIYAIAKK